MMPYTPVDITLQQEANVLIISWSDGRTCRYPVTPLRVACPCAECRGGHEFMGREYDPRDLLTLKADREYHIERLALVGHYALQVVWDDGHDSGIYTWDYLYRLCPGSDGDA